MPASVKSTGTKGPDGILRPETLKTDMTVHRRDPPPSRSALRAQRRDGGGRSLWTHLGNPGHGWPCRRLAFTVRCGAAKIVTKLPIQQVRHFPVKAERSGCQRQCYRKVNRVDLAAKRTYILGCFFAAVVVSRFLSAADATVARCTVGTTAPWR